jgi:hypothetical protein
MTERETTHKQVIQMSKENEELPRIVASITMMIPSLTLRTGWAYLRMKKQAQKISKELEKSMIDNGLPPEMARELAGEFGEGMSITSIMRMASRSRCRP